MGIMNGILTVLSENSVAEFEKRVKPLATVSSTSSVFNEVASKLKSTVKKGSHRHFIIIIIIIITILITYQGNA